MTEEELDRMKHVAREALAKQAKREDELSKFKDMLDKAYEPYEKERDEDHIFFYTSSSSSSDFAFKPVPEKEEALKGFSYIGSESYKNAQSIMNTMLSDLAEKDACAPKEKTCSKNYIMQLFDKGDKARSAAEEAILDDFIKAWEEGVDNLEQEPTQAKEKTYSQADMDGAQRIIDNLLNNRQTQIGREKEFMALHTQQLEEEQARGNDLERENDMLKIHNKNLYDSQKEFCDRYQCDCGTVVWVDKKDTDRVLCPQCESWIGKGS